MVPCLGSSRGSSEVPNQGVGTYYLERARQRVRRQYHPCSRPYFTHPLFLHVPALCR